MHTPEMSSGGQTGKCSKCGMDPIIDGDEVYDGCLGKLQGGIMNACCGHGDKRIAYIQYWSGERVAGENAIREQERLISIRKKL